MIANAFDCLDRRGVALLGAALLLVSCGTEAGSGAVGFTTNTTLDAGAADSSAVDSED